MLIRRTLPAICGAIVLLDPGTAALAVYREEWLNARQLAQTDAAAVHARSAARVPNHGVQGRSRSTAVSAAGRSNHQPRSASSDPIAAFAVNRQPSR